jgi:hypothetical protein
MGGTRAHAQRILAPRQRVQPGARGRAFDATDIERIIQHALQYRLRVVHQQLHRGLRVQRDEAAQQLADTVAADRVAGTDTQFAEQLVGAGGGVALQCLHAHQHLACLRQHGATACVQVQALARAIEQHHADAPLQLGQRHARRGLGEVQLFGGGAHAAQRGDGNEHLELARRNADHARSIAADRRKPARLRRFS